MNARRANRQAITLMEVILALAIFVGSLFVIAQLVGHGTMAVERARLETSAGLLAESKLGELTSGVVPIMDGGDVFDSEPDWRWRLRVFAGPIPGLKRVRIVVSPAPGARLGSSAASFQFTLERWIHVESTLPSTGSFES